MGYYSYEHNNGNKDVQNRRVDQLTRNLEQAQKAMADMGDELGTVKFNPHDPASIDAAVQEVAIIGVSA